MRFSVKAFERNGRVSISFADEDIPWYVGLVAELEGEEKSIAKKVLAEMRRSEALVGRTLTTLYGGLNTTVDEAQKLSEKGFTSTCRCHVPHLGHVFGGGETLFCSLCSTAWFRHQYDQKPCRKWLHVQPQIVAGMGVG